MLLFSEFLNLFFLFLLDLTTPFRSPSTVIRAHANERHAPRRVDLPVCRAAGFPRACAGSDPLAQAGINALHPTYEYVLTSPGKKYTKRHVWMN